MHPAQSQGMNISIRCADALTAALVATPDDPAEALAGYERTTRPAIDPVLDANHQAGSLFDTTAPEPIEQFTAMLVNWARTLRRHSATRSRPPGTPRPADQPTESGSGLALDGGSCTAGRAGPAGPSHVVNSIDLGRSTSTPASVAPPDGFSATPHETNRGSDEQGRLIQYPDPGALLNQSTEDSASIASGRS